MADYPDLQTTEEGREFEKAIDQFLSAEKRDYPSYYGGLKVASGVEFIIHSPIDESIRYGIFQEPEEGIMEAAVEATLKAYGEWSKVPVAERAAYFEKYLALLKVRRMYYAAMVTVSTGMVRQDALLEVDTLIAAIEGILKEAKTFRGSPVGVWAQRRRQYLKQHHKILYYNLLTSCTLTQQSSRPRTSRTTCASSVSLPPVLGRGWRT